MRTLVSQHFPGTSGCQYFSTGEHSASRTRTHSIFVKMRPAIMIYRHQFSTGVFLIRKMRMQIEHLSRPMLRKRKIWVIHVRKLTYW